MQNYQNSTPSWVFLTFFNEKEKYECMLLIYFEELSKIGYLHSFCGIFILIDFLCKLIDLLLYDKDLGHHRVKYLEQNINDKVGKMIS